MMVITLLLWLLLQLSTLDAALGASVGGWSVKYHRYEICAVKGSTVRIHSEYKHPSHLRGVKTFWVINPVKDVDGLDLREEPGYLYRVEYLEGETKIFSLILKNVTEKDENMFCLRIISDSPREKMLGFPGVKLRVTDLRVNFPERVSEGNTTLLTCTTTCSLANTTVFIWYKDGRPVKTADEGKNILSLRPTRIEDAGSYSCAVKGTEHLPSPAVTLNVRHPPKNTSVSISPSAEMMEGGSVTLTCSSDGNPPVQNYTWFKEKQTVGRGKIYTISDFSSEKAGEYKCKSSNSEGHQYSKGVTLNVVAARSSKGVIGVVVCCMILFFAALLIFLRWKKASWSEGHIFKKDSVNSKTATQTANQEGGHYANIVQQRTESFALKSASVQSEVQYATVQHHPDKQEVEAQEEDVPYACVTFKPSPRYAPVENPSVIYSAIK